MRLIFAVLAALWLSLAPSAGNAQQCPACGSNSVPPAALVLPGVGTVGSAHPLPVTGSGGGGTFILGPSQNGIGNVGGKTVSVCVTPTVTTSNSYGTNYVVGGLLTFAGAFTTTGSGILQGVVVTIHEVETSGFTFFPFHANPTATTWTDAAVAAINTADVAKVRNPVALGANSQLASSGFTVASAAGLGEALAPGTTSLYGVLIANATLTTQFAAATDVQVCIKVLDDL